LQPEAALEHIATARALASQIADAEEKAIIEADLASIPLRGA